LRLSPSGEPLDYSALHLVGAFALLVAKIPFRSSFLTAGLGKRPCGALAGVPAEQPDLCASLRRVETGNAEARVRRDDVAERFDGFGLSLSLSVFPATTLSAICGIVVLVVDELVGDVPAV
jgi:hypothetical protein